MNAATYTLRVFPEASPVFSFTPNAAVDVDFATALAEAHGRPDCDTWRITRMSDGVTVAQFDATGLDAMLWRNYRRDELAAARRIALREADYPLTKSTTPRKDSAIERAFRQSVRTCRRCKTLYEKSELKNGLCRHCIDEVEFLS